MPRLRGKAAQLFFSPALPASEEPSAGRGGGPHGQSPDNQKGKTSPGGQLRKNGFPGCKKTSVPGKDGGFSYFFRSGRLLHFIFGNPVADGAVLGLVVLADPAKNHG